MELIAGYVAVLGKPNVGKSTLANQMIGQKLSIVTNKPQTTRHRILGICSGPEYQVWFFFVNMFIVSFFITMYLIWLQIMKLVRMI